MDELLPCPFCGGMNLVFTYRDDYNATFWCVGCSMYGPSVCGVDDGLTINEEKAKAIELWNRRSPSLFGRPVIESDAQEALNKAMEELFLHGDAVRRPVGFLPLDSAANP